ncbi:MAG: autotransporter-associated beta strand repeat-containing protein, partial [Thermoguttaceae bacterium]|nr:autotransporter-associated beta strand repeat-containing protein [Thermoguttaceae bacterium]
PVLISGNPNNPNAAIAFNANTTRLNVADVTRAAGAATDNLPDLIISTPITDAYNMNKYEAASVEKLGEGTATFSGANTYTGLTYVSAGTLNITGSSFKSRLVVRNGGTAVIDAGDGTVTMNADGYGSSLMIGNGTNGTLIIDSGNVTVRNSGNNTGSVQLGTNAACVGVLTINDGSMQVDGRILFAANNANANAALNMNGGTLTLGVPGAYSPGGDPGCGVLWFGGGTSTVNLNGGTIAMYAMRNNSPKNGSTFNFNGGTIQAVADNDTSFFTQAGDMKFYVKPGGAIFDTNGHNVTVSANIKQGIDEGDAAGGFTKKGEGKLTMTLAPAYTGSTTVEQGTLALSAGGTLYNLSGGSLNDDGSVAVAATLDASGQALTLNNTETSKFVGSIAANTIEKTGEGTLKIRAESPSSVTADQFTVSAGELDFRGQYNGDLFVASGATLSPGNSVGSLTAYGDVVIDNNGTILFEFSPYNDNPEMQEFDTLAIANADNAFSVDTN